MAPEVFRGEPYNHKADVFSFAVTCYELLHRQLILSAILDKMPVGASHEEIEVAILEYASAVSAGYRPPLSPHLPASLRKLIQDCWTDVPTDRPAMDKVEAQIRVILRTENFFKMDQPPGTVVEEEIEEPDLAETAAANLPTIPSETRGLSEVPSKSSVKSPSFKSKTSSNKAASASRTQSAADMVAGGKSQGVAHDERPSWERPGKDDPSCGCILS